MAEREILELYGPWFRHPDGRWVDWKDLPEERKRELRGDGETGEKDGKAT